MENLLENLNAEQVAAATHKGGPLMIIAGAGTGKTTMITHRIGWLIEQKLAAPENILALTFTEKAAAEMEERVDRLLPYGYVDLQLSTFHAFCEKVLRDYGVEMGLSRDFKLVNELDAWLLTRANLERFELDYYRPLGNPTKYIRSLLSHFSRAKDEMITPEQYLAYAEGEKANLDSSSSDDEATSEVTRLLELARAYHTYQQILLENDALDFGDLVMYTLQLLEKRPKVLAALRAKFTYILVDEFQDTNWAQYELVKKLAAPSNNLTVVGDDDQSIYKFRGASLSNILQFETDYPDCKRVVLTKNYRSGQTILDAAYKFIQMNNPNRLEGRASADGSTLVKKLLSERELTGHVQHLHYATLADETKGVAEQILSTRKEHPDAEWSDFGVLVRANASADEFIQTFERYGIPYQFMALRGLYTKPVVLDLLATLQLVDNPYHSPSMYRALSHPLLEVSTHELVTLTHEADKKGKTLYEICRQVRVIQGVGEPAARSIESFLSKLEAFAQRAKSLPASEIVVLVAKESGLIEYVNGLSEQKKLDDFRFLQQFHERVKRFDVRAEHRTLHAFLEEFRHERDAGEEGALAMDVEAGPDVVRIMTVHGSKGLEFRFVFVVNMVDRRFPTSERKEAIELPDALVKEHQPEGDWHLEEERRLFYVAMTRAKDALYFTSAEDYGGARKKKLSRFLIELETTPSKPSLDEAVGPFVDTAPQPQPENDVIYQLPKQFSFTQLKAFETCPLQYKFAHILNIPIFGSHTKSYGSTMHNTLQEWFRLWIERSAKTQQGLFGSTDQPPTSANLPASLEELLHLFDEQWIDDWYQNDRAREEYRAKGVASLKAYVDLLEKNPPKPFALEQGFTLKIGDVSIKGRIDRMDEIEGGVEIIDYKTGTPKEKLAAGDKEQLLLYHMAAEEILKLVPKKLTYHYLEDHSEQSFTADPDEIADFKERILEEVTQMKSSQFGATPGFHCRFCDFRDICEFREGS